MKKLLTVLVVLLALSLPTFAQTTEESGDLNGFIELLRSDLRTEKVALLTEEMGLTEAQAEAFWPLQRAYEADLAPILDRRVAAIKSYAEQWGSLTDDSADALMKEMFSILKDRENLREATYKKMKKAVGALVAARFIQIENAVQNLVDLQISAELPILE